MLKVKLVPMTLLVPVIDNSGDHDCKMDEQRYAAIHGALEQLEHSVADSGNLEALIDGNHEMIRQGVSQNAQVAFATSGIPDTSMPMPRQVPHIPVSQIDPPIDTTVRDSEMRSNSPEMTLEELRERPERTKAPPRPRANSWRHDV